MLDVYYPIRHMVEHPPPAENLHLRAVEVSWDEADELRDVLLATFGSYPTHEEIGKD